MKVCKICAESKPLTSFSKRGESYRSDCLKCSAASSLEWYWNNKEEAIKRRKIRDKDRKIKVFSHYSEGVISCACCNESTLEFMSLDHVNNDGYIHRKEVGNGQKLYRWIINNNYPKGFQILCMNCNFAKGQFKICPHQR